MALLIPNILFDYSPVQTNPAKNYFQALLKVVSHLYPIFFIITKLREICSFEKKHIIVYTISYKVRD